MAQVSIEQWRMEKRVRIDEGLVQLLLRNVTVLPQESAENVPVYSARIPRAISHRITDSFLNYFGGASVSVSKNSEAIVCHQLAKGTVRDMAMSLAAAD